MNATPAILGIYRSSSPAEAFRALVDALSGSQAPHCAAWVGPDRTDLLCCHPDGLTLPAELLSIAGHVSQPEVFSLAALSPVASERFPGSDLLLLPLPPAANGPGAVIVVGPRGAFGEELARWDQVAEALASVAEHDRRLREANEERDALRKRAQEMEALDVLGLAVNRTLDPDEVLSLVARFTRTLLGAHYAIVHTADGRTGCAPSPGWGWERDADVPAGRALRRAGDRRGPAADPGGGRGAHPLPQRPLPRLRRG